MKTSYQKPPQHAAPSRSGVKLPVFSVVKVSPVETGTLKCFVDVQIGRGPNAITVCKWRLIQQEGQPPWLSAPQESWLDQNGERRYTNIFKFPKTWGQALTETALAAWEAHKNGGEAKQ